MRCRSTAVLFAALAALCCATSVGAQGDLNCSDFSSQREAQLILQEDPSDPNDLDRNENGIACEDFFGGIGVARPSSEVMVSADDTSGNVSELPATGSGPASSASMQSYAATLAAACSLVAVFAALMLTRHRREAKPAQA